MDNEEMICYCSNVTRGQIIVARKMKRIEPAWNKMFTVNYGYN